MTRSILRAVVCGVILGVMAFFVPHLLVGIFILMLIFRAFHCCMGHGCHGHGRKAERLFYLADKIRKMSDEEYAEFKEKMGGNCCGSHGHSHCGCGCNCCGGKCSCNSSSDNCNCESKKETKE